ncbi:MAG: hypothetical protein RLZZ495_457, partial [Pseudomonadota bacterium]
MENETNQIQAEVERLRAQFPDTQELYREVSALLFFRYGITPTANKLYQLVRKGSMSAPAEALNKFWETLREKSRIRIEHPDLPESLRDAAAAMLTTVWQQAQTQAQEGLQSFREDAQAKIDHAHNAAQATAERLQVSEAAAKELGQSLQSTQSALNRAQTEMGILQNQVETAMTQRRELQESLNALQQRFTHELEQQRTASAAAAERFATESKRLLLEIDRERTHAAKISKDLNKEIDTARAALMEQTQRNAELEGSMAEIRQQRDHLNKQ